MFSELWSHLWGASHVPSSHGYLY